MAQSTTNLGKIHVFPSETLYNQFKGIIADNDLVLLKDDRAYIVASLSAQNGYVKFSNGLMLQWGTYSYNAANFPISFSAVYQAVAVPTTSTTLYGNPSPHVPICTSLNNNSVQFSSYYLTQQQANQWAAVNASGRYIAVGRA